MSELVMFEENDILVDIPEDETYLVAEMYKLHQECPSIYCTLKNFINWRENGYTDALQLTSPGNNWRKDGTIFLLAQFVPDWIDVVVYTLDNTGQSLYEAIVKTKRLNVEGTVQFYGLHESLESIVLEAAQEKGWSIKANIPNTTFSISVENAQQLDIKAPPEILIEKLSTDDVDIINNNWPHRYPGSEIFISKVIERNGGYGLYLKENKQLVSWVLINQAGILGAVQVLEEHKRKGYGSLITKYASKEIARTRRVQPTGNVVKGNTASEQMFTKNGFHKVAGCCYIGFVTKC